MPIEYEGDGTATQAPSPPPSVATSPIGELPEDADPRNAASIEQPFKVGLDYLDFLRRTIFMHGAILNDDFWGDTLNRAHWINPDTGIITVIDDAAADGLGAAKFTSASATPKSLKTRPLKVGTRDFLISARARHVDAVSVSRIGFQSATAGERAYFILNTTGGGDVTINLANADPVPGAFASIGVAYRTLDILRADGVVSFFFNGALAYSGAFATSLNTVELFAEVEGSGGSPADSRLDDIKLWVGR